MNDKTIENHSDNIEQMVTFSLGLEEFGVNILLVQEINRMVEITRVPQTDYCVEGIINLRGKVIPIIDLRKKFDMPEKDNNNQTRIVVVDISDDTVGLVVDSVSEVLRIPTGLFENAPKLITSTNEKYSCACADYIKSIVKLEDRLLLYLNLEKIVKTSSIPMNETIIAEVK